MRNMMMLMIMVALTACAGSAMAKETNERTAHGYGTFEFALIGDTPYGLVPGDINNPVELKFDNVVKDINGNRKIRWILHAGDIKAGSTPCSDDMFEDRLQRYNQFNAPFILTPGDNEWTDCHRAAAGGYQPLERLARLREVFYANPGVTLGVRPMQVKSQAYFVGYEEFPENVMWDHQRVVFPAIHIVGSNNALNDFAGRTGADDEEVARRLDAGLAWLDATFKRAERIRAPGVFLMIHANPNLERGLAIGPAFASFMSAVEQRSIAFGKPVVLAHGDSHYFRVDKPALVDNGFVANFTRVETFGSSNYHWIKVRVSPKSERVFTFEQQVVRGN